MEATPNVFSSARLKYFVKYRLKVTKCFCSENHIKYLPLPPPPSRNNKGEDDFSSEEDKGHAEERGVPVQRELLHISVKRFKVSFCSQIYRN